MSLQALKLQIKTPHYDKTITYYQRVLQAEVSETWENEGMRGTVLRIQSLQHKVYLEIYEDTKLRDYSAFSVQFSVPSVNDYMLQLPAEYLTARPIKRQWGSTYLHLSDPNGVRVTIFQHG